LEQLLELLAEKSLINQEELERIKEAAVRDRERLTRKWKELEAREEALREREEQLKGKGLRLQREKPIASTEAQAEQAPTKAAQTSPDSPKIKTAIPLEISYDNGFCLNAPEHDAALCLGGLLQTDYRFYGYDDVDAQKDKFDLRRVRLRLAGHVSSRFDYKFEYEFQGAGSRNLLDAYGDAHILPYLSFRIGQFKEPFGLEQNTRDSDIFFAERSMGYFLTPQRDVGLMAHASLWNGRVDYAFGFFNGDGLDDTASGDVDAPEWTGRLVFAPFKHQKSNILQDLQVGGSGSYAPIDRNNVDIHVKTAGLTPFFDVSSMAKFNIIREVSDRSRLAAELAWAYSSFAFMGEYVNLTYRNIDTSSEKFDTTLQDYYLAFLWMITGENPSFRNGILQPIRPQRNLFDGGWGGLALALRYDHFIADKSVYDHLINAGDSVREAEAFTVAVNWYLSPLIRMTFDYTRTDFDQPLLIGRDALKGTSFFSDYEDSFTTRFQMGF
jgi:phosphate-selective porin OprO/OprP